MDFKKKANAEANQKIESASLPSQNSFIVLGNVYVTNNEPQEENFEVEYRMDEILDKLQELKETVNRYNNKMSSTNQQQMIKAQPQFEQLKNKFRNPKSITEQLNKMKNDSLSQQSVNPNFEYYKQTQSSVPCKKPKIQTVTTVTVPKLVENVENCNWPEPYFTDCSD